MSASVAESVSFDLKVGESRKVGASKGVPGVMLGLMSRTTIIVAIDGVLKDTRDGDIIDVGTERLRVSFRGKSVNFSSAR